MPGSLCGVEGVIVLKNGVVMASINDYFIAVSYHVMKGSCIWKHLLNRYVVELMNVNFGQGMHELRTHLT